MMSSEFYWNRFQAERLDAGCSSIIQRTTGLNEAQYRSLCEVCDRVLLSPDSTVERVAIPWLHVIREHPVFLENYVDLFNPTKGIKLIVRKCKRIFRNRAGWYRQVLKSFFANCRPWFGPDKLLYGIDFLFVSHLLNPHQHGQKDDFYFGSLPDELVSRGLSAVIVLINHSGRNAEHLTGNWNGSSVPRVILFGSLGIKEEVTLHRRLKMEAFRLTKLAGKEPPGLARRVLFRASEEALSGGTLSTLRITEQIGALAAKLQPKAIVLTHEGHAFERTVFAAARSARPDIRCIGYQHAALFRLQHAIRRNLAREYNPDQILTAGIVGKVQLERAPGLNGIPISVIGSHRTFKEIEIIRQRSTLSNSTKLFDKPACLVLPEGIASECHLLFEFSLNCAQAYPEIQFIWRLHPIITYESLTLQNRKLRNLPKNIVLSQATFEEDMVRCCWALYRGTTAVVQTVVAGLRPIYLQLPGEMTIDPLYELKCWRISVETIADFHSIIIGEQSWQLRDNENEFKFAQGYCRDFFRALDPDALEAAVISKFKA